MTSRLTLPAAQSALIAAAALLGATLVGLAIAVDVPKGIALATGICYAPLVLINLPLGLCLWIVLVFIEAFPIVSVGPTAAAILIALSWLGTLRTRREVISGIVVRHRVLIASLVLFLVWLTLSAIWARDPGQVFDQLTYHYAAAITFVIVATTLTRPEHLRLAVAAFVIGGVLSVLAGFVVNGISTGGNAAALASEGDSRFGGGSGDPNFLGAGLVPAIVLAGALFRQVRDPIARWMLAVAMVILSVGLAASQSRGGLLAAAVALIAALVLYRRKLPILAFLGLVVAFLWVWFAANPETWDRIRTFDDGGSGRQDLWEVGWRIFEDKPVNGAGLNNFRQESFRYVREPGKLERVDLVAERPRIVHNVYLQMLVETGVVGLALFLVVVLGCLRAMWSAGRRFDRAGEFALGDLSRSVFVATLATLTASFFLSNSSDDRLWVLFGFGPALLAVAIAAQRARARQPARELVQV